MDAHDEGATAVPIDPDLAPSDPAEPSLDHRPGRRGPSRMQPGVLAAIAIGGALGAPLRYEVAERVHVGSGAFPWATFWTNAVGSLALGFVVILLIERFPDSRVVRPFLTAGLLGAFTTFSTFVVEVDVLIKDGHAALGVAYVLSSTVAGLTAAWVGMQSARLVPRTVA